MFLKLTKALCTIVLLLSVSLPNAYTQTNNNTLSESDSIQVNDYKFSYI